MEVKATVGSLSLDENKELLKICDQIQDGSCPEDLINLNDKGVDDDDVIRLTEAINMRHGIIQKIILEHIIEDIVVIVLDCITSVEELNLSCNKIGPIGVLALSKSKIRILNLTANPIGNNVECFSESAHISKLLVGECYLGNYGAKIILKNIRLKVVDLSTNDITDDGLGEIPSNSLLRELNLSQNELTYKCANFLTAHGSLTSINLGSNHLTDKGLGVLLQNDNIISLGLMQNKITNVGLLQILASKKLQHVDLYNNRIGHDEKSSNFPANTSLISIQLGCNKIDDRCELLLESLASIPTLQKLDLCGNRIGDHGARILYRHRSKTLEKINLFSNNIEDAELIVRGIEPTRYAFNQSNENTMEIFV